MSDQAGKDKMEGTQQLHENEGLRKGDSLFASSAEDDSSLASYDGIVEKIWKSMNLRTPAAAGPPAGLSEEKEIKKAEEASRPVVTQVSEVKARPRQSQEMGRGQRKEDQGRVQDHDQINHDKINKDQIKIEEKHGPSAIHSDTAIAVEDILTTNEDILMAMKRQVAVLRDKSQRIKFYVDEMSNACPIEE